MCSPCIHPEHLWDYFIIDWVHHQYRFFSWRKYCDNLVSYSVGLVHSVSCINLNQNNKKVLKKTVMNVCFAFNTFPLTWKFQTVRVLSYIYTSMELFCVKHLNRYQTALRYFSIFIHSLYDINPWWILPLNYIKRLTIGHNQFRFTHYVLS